MEVYNKLMLVKEMISFTDIISCKLKGTLELLYMYIRFYYINLLFFNETVNTYYVFFIYSNCNKF